MTFTLLQSTDYQTGARTDEARLVMPCIRYIQGFHFRSQEKLLAELGRMNESWLFDLHAPIIGDFEPFRPEEENTLAECVEEYRPVFGWLPQKPRKKWAWHGVPSVGVWRYSLADPRVNATAEDWAALWEFTPIIAPYLNFDNLPVMIRELRDAHQYASTHDKVLVPVINIARPLDANIAAMQEAKSLGCPYGVCWGMEFAERNVANEEVAARLREVKEGVEG